ncbi:acetolactate synthase large subunit [Actinomyces bouchesdurhonensis]|uniref:acetolactate synthase large subunit n=1 Tax=Actinomyces bouchesdurhonensis TaxID=1852361 RepID=UPI0028E70603|nr:acetolactate synthase large subunit [Actinomyces bouchesdurhonensis]
MVSDTSITTRMTGAEAIVASLEALGVTDVFGMPGGAILPTYDPLMASTAIRHILVRHEQGAGHAAEGYAIASGKVGCALVTSGPGATNVLTALGDAAMDSVPIVVISGQVGASLIGTDAFQEADVVGASMPITKHSFLVTNPQDIPARLAEAFHLAATGRPGPVLVDITKSAQVSQMDFSWPPALDLPGYKVADRPNMKQVRAAARAIVEAQAPVLYVGGGVIRGGATEALAALVEATNAPVVTTLTARGAFPDSDRHNLGMPGMHGTVAAVGALQRADLIVALGARFDDRVTGRLDSFAPRATVVHIDIDAAEISKNRHADIPIVADLATALPILTAEIVQVSADGAEDISGWWRYLDRLRTKYPIGWTTPEDGMMAPQAVLKKLSDRVGPDAIYVTGVGQHQMWASQFITLDNPRSFISSCGSGTMGYCIPAAMGAQVGAPGKVVWAIDGDGSFQMTNQELATCTINNIPIKVALINNSVLGMVRQWQSLFFGKRYSNTTLNPVEGEQIPNFEMLAQAYGMAARTVRSIDEVDEAIEWAMSINDRPVLIDFRVSKDAMVWPMVAAGVSNDEIRYAKGMAPDWEVED